MRLRERLLLNTLIVSSVLAPTVYVINHQLRQRDADRTLADAIEASMSGDGRSRCETQPATFGGGTLDPIPPLAILRSEPEARPQIFAYDATFRSANPSAPAFPDDLRAALTAGRQQAVGLLRLPGGRGRHVAARMPWVEGPCAILLSRFGPYTVPFLAELTRITIIYLTFSASSLLAAGFIIRRIRRLTLAVRRSADSMYAIGVPATGHDEIGELEGAFNRAGELVKTHVATIEAREGTIRDREAALRAVVSNTTHDVAVPLTVVQGHLSAAQTLLAADHPAHQALRGAIREAHYLAALLHNLSVASRLDRPAFVMERRPLDLNALVSRVVARHAPIAATLGVELGDAVPEAPLMVSADVTLLEQAVSNLVHNAVHYNKSGGHVAVVLEPVDSGRRFSLRVIDDGPGIPVEEHAQLTERTFRGATGRARRRDGQGLGLHIVREVTERHGFDLHIGQSEFGGAEVEIESACSAGN